MQLIVPSSDEYSYSLIQSDQITTRTYFYKFVHITNSKILNVLMFASQKLI